MLLDPPGFTGPSTLCDHPFNGNVHHSYAFSDSSTRNFFLSRRLTPVQISFFRRGRSVDVFVINGASYLRRYTILEYRRRFISRGAVRASSYDCHDFTSNTTVVDCWENEFEIRNATAFHVSYHSVYRSGIRSRIRSVANIWGRKGRTSRFCRGFNGDRYAHEETRNDHDDDVRPVEHSDHEDYDDDNDDNDDDDDDGGGGGGDGGDNNSGNDVGSVVFAAELNLSVPQIFKSRSFHHIECNKPRTRWKKPKKKVRRDHRNCQESIDFARIPNANATDVPPFAAFAYTAYNDENENESEGGASRAIGYVSDGEEIYGQDIGHRDTVEFVERNETNGIRGKSRKLLGYRYQNSWQRNTRETLRVKGGKDEKCKSHYTARFQEPIANESCERETKISNHGPTKASNSCGRKYGLLFILYLLAWPLVCSTNPSGQFPSSFTHNPSLSPADHLPQHNATHISSLLSSSTAHRRQQQQQQQQQHKEQQQYYRQLEEKHQTRDQLVRDAEYSWDGNGHHRRRHEEQQGEQGREQREVEESSYRDRQAVLESKAMHPYNEYSWEVNQINPWLSACDLAGPAPADLQGSCGPPEVPKTCPIPCTVNLKGRGKGNDAEFHEIIEKFDRNDRNENVAGDHREKSEGVRMAPEQCLFYLEESHKRDICRDDFGQTSTRSFLTPRENRYWFMSGLRLRHCCEHAVVNALAPGKGGPLENVLNGGQKCADALDKLLRVDALAARLHCEFEEVLARYDCAQPYSVIFNCTHCKEAYRKWVCSSLVPYFAHGGPQDLDTLDNWAGSRLRPCRSFCQSVEQRCPYLLPGDRAPAYPTQYAGEPTFLCRDPNIPETGEQAARALHSGERDECCFHACSEETPGSGICANCTDQEPRIRRRVQDPATAPHCEINPIQPASIGGEYPELDLGSTDSSIEEEEEERYDSSTDSAVLSMMNVMQQQGTSLCGSGGVGSMTSVSSSDRSTASILPQLFWLCSILSSTLGNVRTVPVFWISKIFLWSIVPLGGGNNSDGACGCDDSAAGSSSMKMIRFVVWLCRCMLHRASYIEVQIRYGAKWLLEKWITVEDRCWSWWWCCCWYWWWWRWQPVQRQREDSRSQQFIATCPIVVRRMPAATTASRVENDSRETFRESLYVRSTLRANHSSRWHFSTGHGYSMKRPWHRLSWWWWWLYRWWRSIKTHYGGSTNNRTSPHNDDNLRAFPRGQSEMVRRRRGNRKRRKERNKDSVDTFEVDVQCSPTIRRRYLKVFSRNDPP